MLRDLVELSLISEPSCEWYALSPIYLPIVTKITLPVLLCARTVLNELLPLNVIWVEALGLPLPPQVLDSLPQETLLPLAIDWDPVLVIRFWHGWIPLTTADSLV